MLVHELYRHRPFADGGGAALPRAGANVAGGEDAGHAGRKEAIRVRSLAGEDEPVGVARNRVLEPLRARSRAEEEEEVRERQAPAVPQRDFLETVVRPVLGGDLAVIAHGDAVAF